MADILIRGMDKPRNCFRCDLSYLRGERLFCCVTKDEVLRSKIAPDCPIQELPEHGDLIDLDERVTKQVYNEYNMEWDMKTKTVRQWLNIDVADMPVIVPSNKEITDGD